MKPSFTGVVVYGFILAFAAVALYGCSQTSFAPDGRPSANPPHCSCGDNCKCSNCSGGTGCAVREK